MSTYIWHDKESRKSRHERRKTERILEEEERSKLVESVGVGLELPPFEFRDGDHEQTLEVPEGCAGMIIGKKGANLKSVEERFKVKVSLDKGKATTLVVRGPNHRDVSLAARELDFAEEELEIDPAIAGWACGKGGRHLRMLQELSGVAVLKLCSEGGPPDADDAADDAAEAGGDPEGQERRPKARRPATRCWFEIRGRRDQVFNARTCLETHLIYHSLFEEIYEAERAIDQQIVEAQAKLGPSSRRPRSAADEAPSRAGAGRSGAGGKGGSRNADGAAEGSAAKGSGPKGRGRGGRPKRSAGAAEGADDG